MNTLIPFSHGRRKAGRTRVELGLKRVSAFTKFRVEPLKKVGFDPVGSELKMAELEGRTWSDDEIKALLVINSSSTQFTQF